MPGPAIAVGVGIGLQAASSMLGSRAKRKANKKRRALIRKALAQLTPAQFARLAGDLMPEIEGATGGLGEASAEGVQSRANTLGLSGQGNQAGITNQARLGAAQSAFENSINLGGLNSQRYLSQAGAVQPNNNLADLFGMASQGFNAYAGYRGLRGY